MMDSFIIVKGNSKEVKVKLLSGEVNHATLRSGFLLEADVPVALFKDDMLLESHREGDNSIFNLGQDWKGATYKLEWKEERRSRRSSRMDQDVRSSIPSKKAKMVDESFNTPTDLNEKQKEYIERLRKFMFYSILAKTEAGDFENVSTIRSCVTVAEKDLALMAAHCLPFGVPEGFVFEIYSQENQPHLVQVKYVNRKFGFVVLKTVDKGFDACPIGLAYPDVGTEYAVLGYHGYNYQSSNCLRGFFGRIRNNEHFPDLKFVVLSPGTTRGCSGAGAFTLSKLIGIVVSGPVPPQNVYSSTGSLADHVAEACTELAEPSYSHIVPSSTIFALFNQYNKLRS